MIEFPCPNCSVNISAEEEYCGATANCPTCGHELIVPSAIDVSPPHHQPLEHTALPSIQTELAGQHKKSAPKYGKKMITMVGIPIVLVAMICGGIVVGNREKEKPEVKAPVKKEKTLNPISVGGKLSDFVEKFSVDSDRYELFDVARREEKAGYKVLVVSDNSKVIVGYDSEEFITCIIYFKHGDNLRMAIPLSDTEVDETLLNFSRHEDRKWIQFSNVESTRLYGYPVFDETIKFGNRILSASYDKELPYLIIWAGSDRDKATDGLNGTRLLDLQNMEYQRAN